MRKRSKINRKKADIEISPDPEKRQHLKELAIAFQEDQVKIVLRKLYKNVRQYGADVVLEAVNQSWVKTEEEWERSDAVGTEFNPSEASFVVDRNPEKETEDNPESMIHNASGIRHRHEEVLKRNAEFLIESSEKLDDYDQDVLHQMRKAYSDGAYDDVLDLAFLHDREKRPLRVGCLFQTTTQERPDKKQPKMKTVVELLEEVAQEDSEETATQACVNALRHLSRDLTYTERSAAKKEIRRAIQLLE